MVIYDFLSYEIALGSDVRPCIKIDKPLVVSMLLNDFNNNVAYITTNPSFMPKKGLQSNSYAI